ncbi:MAG TPA: aminoglycoside phosphotransferase family protein [Cyclobacteriaceae bacterium]|nr:aminoglycoside phosphotransferase family protein [Cyclobacteriaceae bacterium]
MVNEILKKFAIEGEEVKPVGNGHINKTYRAGNYILQRINNKVFTKPEIIASNLEHAKQHLAATHPEYLFISPLKPLVYDSEGFPWRLYPYIANTYTVDDVQSVDQAYKAAKAFGRFGKYMKGADLSKFKPTIERFHDLKLRYEQFEDALKGSSVKQEASEEIRKAISFKKIVDRYISVIESRTLMPGIFHNDTKINNVLFNPQGDAVAVIDLDTVMEGYFIYDLGDLVRTLVSPVSEEEKDLDKIVVRKEFYDAVIEGYLSEMNDVDRSLASFAGLMMTYIMALRFLADFLRGNTYYHISYPDQNLVRARNQLRLIDMLDKILLK